MKLPTHIVAAGGIVYNDNAQILLVKNPRKGWEFPGGIIENGETVIQGLIREILEESGVHVEVVNLVGIYSSTKKKKGYNGVEEIPTIVNIDFVCRHLSGECQTSVESDEVKWVCSEEALTLINPKQQFRFKKALEMKSDIHCVGFYFDEMGAINVHESYSFER
ncbi:MAG: NUDIX hydrolase [Turicibacter sp.]